MLDECDIAYIHCDQDKRPMLVEKALLAGKHVICDSPFSCTLAEQEKLLALAKEKEVILYPYYNTQAPKTPNCPIF